MQLTRKVAIIAAAAALVLSAAPTAAVPVTINLRAHVPLYCNVELISSPVSASEDGVIDLGTSRELCNSPNGYRIILQHPSDMGDAAIISDMTRIPLSQSGETVVWNSDQPGLEVRKLALDLGDTPDTVKRLGLRIEVKY